jgi:hypothetical protein
LTGEMALTDVLCALVVIFCWSVYGRDFISVLTGATALAVVLIASSVKF